MDTTSDRGSEVSKDPLATLPIELLTRITRHLSTTDLCSVRLVSRGIERALFHSFSHEFFRRKQFMLSDFSLRALIDISNHPELKYKLRHVSIGLDRVVNVLARQFETEEIAIQYEQILGQQMSLFATGRAVYLLATAFANLPNLETVQIREFPSNTRFRDGPSCPWQSYGRHYYDQVVAANHMFLSYEGSAAPETFIIVMAALAKAEAKPVGVEVMVRTRHFGVSSYGFDLTGLQGGNPSLGPTLAVIGGLKRLHLDLSIPQNQAWADVNSVNHHGQHFQPVSVTGLNFHAFLAHAQQLEWLRLNLQSSGVPDTDIFLGALGRPLPAAFPFTTVEGSSASPNVTLPPNLKRLDLGHACMSFATLLDLLRRIPLLEELNLWNITLIDPTYTRAFASTNRTETPNFWRKFLNLLAKEPVVTQLRSISIGNARQLVNVDRRSPSRVSFGQSHDARRSPGHTLSMAAFLAQQASIANPRIDRRDNFDVEDDNDDDDDEEDDEEEDDDEDDDGDDENADGDNNGGDDPDGTNNNANIPAPDPDAMV